MSNRSFTVPLQRLLVGMVSKSPDATLCYSLDWTSWLAHCQTGDTIESAAWTVPDGLSAVSGSEEVTDAVTRITVTGGTAGETYRLECQVTTAYGIVDVRYIDVQVDE